MQSGQLHNWNQTNTFTHSHAERYTGDDWRYEDARITGDLGQFNSRFADLSNTLKDGYYNLNGDIYYKGQKVEGNTYKLPVYETHQDTKTGKTVNTQKKTSQVWGIMLILLMTCGPCLWAVIKSIIEAFE